MLMCQKHFLRARETIKQEDSLPATSQTKNERSSTITRSKFRTQFEKVLDFMNIVLELGTSHGPRKQECCPHQGVFLLVASSRESRVLPPRTSAIFIWA
jgi:hypothetical protein